MARVIPLLCLCLLTTLGACAGPSDPDSHRLLPPPPTDPSMQIAILDWQTADLNSPEALDRYSRTDFLVLESAYLWGRPENAGVVAQLKARNPRLKVVGYVMAQSTHLSWGPSADGRAGNPYARDWYDRTRPYWSFTTTGDTMMIWPDQVMLDVLDPACRHAMVQTVARWQAEGGNPVDGILWDYFCSPFWYLRLSRVYGELDLDGNGIAHFEDPAEQAALLRAQEALVQEMRSTLGSRFLQVFNGTRAHSDSVFAALGDGMMYELFPEVNSGCPPSRALDAANPTSLFAARRWPRRSNGGPWLLLCNFHGFGFVDPDGTVIDYRYSDLNRAIALLTDVAVTYHDARSYTYGWPEVEVDLGCALGPPTRDGDVLTRSFERGSVTVQLAWEHVAVPISFEIVQDGQVRQSLDLPNHVP